MPRGGPLTVRGLGDQPGVGPVGLVPLAAHQAGGLDASRVDHRDVPAGVGQRRGQGLAVGPGTLQAEAHRGPGGVADCLRGEGGIAGRVLANASSRGWPPADVQDTIVNRALSCSRSSLSSLG